MSAGNSVAQLQDHLNRSMPASFRVKLGDLLVLLIAFANAILADVTALRTRVNTSMLTKAGLAIKTGGSPTVRYANPIAALCNGVPVRKAAGDMAALVGTLATAKSAAWAFYIDAAGTLTTSAKTADADTHDAALALLVAPPDNKAMVGFVVVDNATGSGFVGGTTALDTGSLTVTYYDTMGVAPFAAALTADALGDLASR
ncbi:hypothetical protein [Parvibaculum sp.]|uniref:hypothetical protein n=1 Tax=Parvibaculum sp. TaxID=2024848 RepID=UPI0027356153|nr:hypothetical protein [Parvibaculum sp.]MDP3327193.1 hypothetical protein [Parvibaculum sp.]